MPLAVIAIGRDETLVQYPSWASHIRNRTTITLDALEDGDMCRLWRWQALASTGDPPADAIAMAGGNPFFLEEILAMAGEDVGAAVPDTVQGVIAARLDLLPSDDKQLLQRASVVGRTFELETLGVLAAGGGPAGRVRALAERDLVSMAGPRTYQFKHALIRDVAYESIPRSEPARLHLRLARHLDDEGAGTQSIANHYATAAELGAQEVRTDAVDRLLDAAAEARGVYAYGLRCASPAARWRWRAPTGSGPSPTRRSATPSGWPSARTTPGLLPAGARARHRRRLRAGGDGPPALEVRRPADALGRRQAR